ncbi:MAG: lamin tail domain-containing protein [Myxococcales bacterium]|nr:lamin tail domain-containing protein [Myxococcales bacterium]
MKRLHGPLALSFAAAFMALAPACAPELAEDDALRMLYPRVEVQFNLPGSRQQNGTDNGSDDVLVQAIDRARATIDCAVMGFTRDTIIDALLRAHRRGVQLRFVGDARHAFGDVRAYEEFDRLGIEMQVGNQNHIMHDKYFIVDGRFVFTGTGNITGTGFARNDNNWVWIDDFGVAADFRAEFEQQLAGRFGYAKERIDNGNTYEVGDTVVEVHFSPQEDAMGRILEAVEGATDSVEFFIFAFTKDQLGALLIAKHEAFTQYNRCCDPAGRGDLEADEADFCQERITCADPFVPKKVRGVIDRSQLHSNGPYHEIYRLITHGVEVRLDGNDNSRQPGDYQAGGGRLHAKTLIVDGRTDHAQVLTGSFNWSSSATLANDETLLVLRGPRLGLAYSDYFDYLYRLAKRVGERWIGDGTGLKPGDVVFNEIGWDGYNGLVDPAENPNPDSDRPQDFTFNDEFIELLNTTDRPIDLSLWVIAAQDDFVTGLYPGTVIGPYERFLIVDHNVTAYDDLRPQMPGGAYLAPDFVMNMANDQRFLRLNLSNARLALRLLDPRGTEVDAAGDGGAPFAGGRERIPGGATDDPRAQRVRSMERVHHDCEGQSDCRRIGDGRKAASWKACEDPTDEEASQIREGYREHVIATPGQPNSGGEVFPPEDPSWRAPAPAIDEETQAGE